MYVYWSGHEWPFRKLENEMFDLSSKFIFHIHFPVFYKCIKLAWFTTQENKWCFDKWANVWINLNTIIELQKKLLWIAFLFVYIHNAHKLWFLAGARVNDVFPGDELIPRIEMLFLRTLTRVYSSSSINLFLSLIAYNIFSTFKIQER